MFLELSAAEIAALRAFLDRDDDCEALGDAEYVADLYGIEPPVSLNLVFVDGGARIDGASVLGFDEEMDGYYMKEPMASAGEVADALRRAGALGAQ